MSPIRFAIIGRPMNRVIGPVIRSKLGRRFLWRRLAYVTYTGRRSGRVITLPVWYRPTPTGVQIPVRVPSTKTWYKNFVPGPEPITLDIGGKKRHGVGRAVSDGRKTVLDVTWRDPSPLSDKASVPGSRGRLTRRQTRA